VRRAPAGDAGEEKRLRSSASKRPPPAAPLEERGDAFGCCCCLCGLAPSTLSALLLPPPKIDEVSKADAGAPDGGSCCARRTDAVGVGPGLGSAGVCMGATLRTGVEVNTCVTADCRPWPLLDEAVGVRELIGAARDAPAKEVVGADFPVRSSRPTGGGKRNEEEMMMMMIMMVMKGREREREVNKCQNLEGEQDKRTAYIHYTHVHMHIRIHIHTHTHTHTHIHTHTHTHM
jgi:hypothetical protein